MAGSRTPVYARQDVTRGVKLGEWLTGKSAHRHYSLHELAAQSAPTGHRGRTVFSTKNP